MSANDRIRLFIVRELHWTGAPDELTDDYPLIERNVLDSVGIFHLTSFLEREFEMVVDDEELVPENYGSIGRLTSFVESKRTN